LGEAIQSRLAALLLLPLSLVLLMLPLFLFSMR